MIKVRAVMPDDNEVETQRIGGERQTTLHLLVCKRLIDSGESEHRYVCTLPRDVRDALASLSYPDVVRFATEHPRLVECEVTSFVELATLWSGGATKKEIDDCIANSTKTGRETP